MCLALMNFPPTVGAGNGPRHEYFLHATLLRLWRLVITRAAALVSTTIKMRFAVFVVVQLRQVLRDSLFHPSRWPGFLLVQASNRFRR